MAQGLNQELREQVEQAITPLLSRHGYEIVLIEIIARSHVLRLYVDREGGVSIDDCSTVSHMVGDLLDAEGFSDRISGSYELEVSSPGLDRPLVKPAHFQKVLGKQVRITTFEPISGRRKFMGKLVAADDAAAQIEVDGQVYAIPHKGIASARLVPEF